MNAAKDHVEAMNDDMALAHAKFQLGQYLLKQRQQNDALSLFAQCRSLHPDSWNIFRQTTEKMDSGIAAGEEFWAKVMALGDAEITKSVDMEGMAG